MPIFLTILFLIWPFGSLPLILYLIYQQKKYACYFLCALMALFTMYYAPGGDQYRYWVEFQELASLQDTLLDIVSNENVREYCLLFPLMAVIKQLGGTLEHVRFCLVFICLCLSLNFFWNKTAAYRNNNVSSRNYFIVTLLILLLVPIFTITTGFRWGTAVVLFFLSVNYFVSGCKKTGCLLALLACLFHFAIVPCVALFAFYLFVKKYVWQHPILLFIVAGIVGFFLDLIILYLLQNPFFDFVSAYIDPQGVWRIGELSYEVSTKHIIAQYIETLVFNFLLVFVLHFICKYRKNVECKIYDSSYTIVILGFSFVLICLVLLFNNFYTIHSRTQVFIILFPVYTFLLEFLKGNKLFSKRVLAYCTFFICFFSLFLFVAIRHTFYLGKVHKFFYSSFYSSFTNTYSSDFVSQNIDDDGWINK